jgi:hypothetical protein
MKTRIARLAAVVGMASLLCAGAASAQEVPFIDGQLWKDSAPVLKRAYLIGISNLLNAEYAYQKEFGPPPDKQTSIQRLYEAIDEVTLDGAAGRIDAWYKANPDKMETTVLEVIWLDMVRPNRPDSRRYHSSSAQEKK